MRGAPCLAVFARHGRGATKHGVGSRPGPPACTGAIADWCDLFSMTYQSFGTPRELQQISISDPTNTTCPTVPAPTCGTPPLVSGDLRMWLPFAVANNATVFEIYYQALGLAFDPQYCNVMAGTCYFPAPGITVGDEMSWYSSVGQGNSSCVSGTATGCYSTAINQADGPHQ